jgi:L-cysteine desulfidase
MEKQKILRILKKELVVAMGCTEPAAAALAGAKAAELLGRLPEKVSIFASRDMIKNAMGVGIPNCSICGIQAAVCLGICGGDPRDGLSLLAAVTEEQQQRAIAMIPRTRLKMVSDVSPVYIHVLLAVDGETVECTISHEHDRFTSIVQGDKELCAANEVILPDMTGALISPEKVAILSLGEILEFTSTVKLSEVRFVLDGAIINLDLAKHSIAHSYGLSVGKVALDSLPEKSASIADAISRGAGLAAGASDARMSGCPKAVVINSGSGNQGITCSVPVLTMAEYLKCSDLKTARALCISQLVALSLTARKERLSALCGAFTAAIGAGCGYVYLMGGGEAEMDMTIRLMVANLTGIVCDGAKQTCALKIYSCIIAAGLSCQLAFKGKAPGKDSGIVGKDSTQTINHLTRICHEGMLETDKTILAIMLDSQK